MSDVGILPDIPRYRHPDNEASPAHFDTPFIALPNAETAFAPILFKQERHLTMLVGRSVERLLRFAKAPCNMGKSDAIVQQAEVIEHLTTPTDPEMTRIHALAELAVSKQAWIISLQKEIYATLRGSIPSDILQNHINELASVRGLLPNDALQAS